MRKKILILFFLGLIASPVAGLIFKSGPFFQEGPLLAPLPAFTRGALFESGFYKGLESYLDARNPFRARLIRTNSRLDVAVFKTSSTDVVHMGLNHWLYYRPAYKSFFKADCKKKKKALELARTLHRLERRLTKAGKRFIFIVAPDKSTIYPEYMGGVREANGCNRSFYDLFLEELKRYPVKGFIRLDQVFLEAKKKHRLYYIVGSHWNDRGAALVVKLILEKLSTPKVSYHLPEIDFREKTVLSDLSNMLSVNLYELAPVAESIRFKAEVKTDNIEALPFFPGESTKLRTRAHCVSCGPLLPKAIIYRDSFMTAPLKFLKGSFKEIYARWSIVFPEETEAGARELAASDIIILEVVERDLARVGLRPAVAMRQIKMTISANNPTSDVNALK